MRSINGFLVKSKLISSILWRPKIDIFYVTIKTTDMCEIRIHLYEVNHC